MYITGRALELNPEIGKSFVGSGHEVASHQYRWVNYRNKSYFAERDDLLKTIRICYDLLETILVEALQKPAVFCQN